MYAISYMYMYYVFNNLNKYKNSDRFCTNLPKPPGNKVIRLIDSGNTEYTVSLNTHVHTHTHTCIRYYTTIKLINKHDRCFLSKKA